MSTSIKGETPPIKRRSPRGTVTDKPVAVRLLPSERQQLEEVAAKEQRCLSNMARLLMLQGLAAYADKN